MPLYMTALTVLALVMGQGSASLEDEVRQLRDMLTNTTVQVENLAEALQNEKQLRKQTVEMLCRQLNLQQLYVEEQTRASGDSGVKVTRLTRSGSRSYYADSYTGLRSVLAIHNHANLQDTLGMGEIQAVLNGVEFRTRHNDYRLMQPSRTSRQYGATQPITPPLVPPEVLSKATVAEQSAELREWFKAFNKQDPTQRDYRKYFKPVLCYLEGMWTITDLNKMDEPFSSLRHSIDAPSFYKLQDSIRFTTSTGRKNIQENFAFLPTTVYGVSEDGIPQFAQWNYDILCHPITHDVPLSRLRLMDDLGGRMARRRSTVNPDQHRVARYTVWNGVHDPNEMYQKLHADEYYLESTGKYMDQLMAQIPGKDNYPANITDDAWDEVAYPTSSPVGSSNKHLHKPLQAGYYHRAYRTVSRDAMGASILRKSFNDDNLYMALTTNSKVQGHTSSRCNTVKNCKTNCERCKSWTQRVSYAVPLEIVYLTPLMTWNPYNVTYHQNTNNPVTLNRVGRDSRTGGLTESTAYNGASLRTYYITPANFYDGAIQREDAADTSYRQVGVLDSTGNVREMAASGVSILTPSIAGIGRVRTRYPIMPSHASGSTTQKELDALTELTLHHQKYNQFYPGRLNLNNTVEELFHFVMSMTNVTNPPHYHDVYLTESQLRAMKYNGAIVTVRTEMAQGHTHELKVDYGMSPTTGLFYVGVRQCDNRRTSGCEHGHHRGIYCLDCQYNGYTYPV